jgi:hypothetical protein
MTANTLQQGSSALVSSTRTETGLKFESVGKPWTEIATPRARSWHDVKVEHRTAVKRLIVTFSTPLDRDIDVEGLLLPAGRQPVRPLGVYALAINRYTRLVLSDDADALNALRVHLEALDGALVGDASCSVSSALLSGANSAALLEKATFAPVSSLGDGEYCRLQFGHSALIVHRDGDCFWLHWPEALTEYVCSMFESLVAMERD